MAIIILLWSNLLEIAKTLIMMIKDALGVKSVYSEGASITCLFEMASC